MEGSNEDINYCRFICGYKIFMDVRWKKKYGYLICADKCIEYLQNLSKKENLHSWFITNPPKNKESLENNDEYTVQCI